MMTQKNPSIHISSLIKLVLLGAIWGSSFLFMWIAAPVLGPFVTANIRCLLAGVLLSSYVLIIGLRAEWKKNAKHYLIVGLLQCAIPFTLFPYAIRSLPPSYAGILNATSPLFSVIISWIFLKEPIYLRKLMGLIISMIGVSLVLKIGSTSIPHKIGWPVAACLLAALCYALAAIYAKRYASHTKPLGLAAGSQLFAGLVLIPLSILNPPTLPIHTGAVLSVITLAVLCTAIAFIVFYQLIQEAGTSIAVSTGFLIPVFAMLWSFIFLKQPISLLMALGAALTLTGVLLVVYQPTSTK